ncbi:MAG: hypothetical protein KA116_05085 [Proteobacteria bacterium]|nr:hypothetical protein [Pseudomonadota bacterium]
MHISIIALPIGNSLDLSPRAKSSLENSQIVLCEDTRKFKQHLQQLNLELAAKFISFPAFKEREWNWELFFKEHAEKNIALVSDAGTPIINDPGEDLLREAHNRKIHVTAIPGPCAPITALQWSGGFGVPFCFAGFTPKSHKEKFFSKIDTVRSFIFFDTRHECLDTLEYLMKIKLEDRKIFIAREMTKSHEELFAGNVKEAFHWLKKLLSDNKGVGELTLILEGLGNLEAAHKRSLEELLKIRFGSDKEASKILSELCDEKTSDCYGAIQKWKNS